MNTSKLSGEEYVLYILNRLEPERSDKIRLNKLAFFVEFAYLSHYGESLSDIDYAAINLGPVIDNYDSLLEKMKKSSLVVIDGYKIRPLVSDHVAFPDDIEAFINTTINKYSQLSKSELIGLSHLTDAYKITTNNEKLMGRLIDKDLAKLETFLTEDDEDCDLIEEDLPKIDRSNLVGYATTG